MGPWKRRQPQSPDTLQDLGLAQTLGGHPVFTIKRSVLGRHGGKLTRSWELERGVGEGQSQETLTGEMGQWRKKIKGSLKACGKEGEMGRGKCAEQVKVSSG